MPDDANDAQKLETIMGRLPKPRATGAKGRFGIHARISPQILAHARAIGLTWERIHDCSQITKMGYANPKRGEYRWADAEVDALRSYGFSILGMPDYPPKWFYTEKWIEDENAKKRAEAKENAIKLPDSGEMNLDSDEDEILADIDKRRRDVDKKARSYKVVLCDIEAFRTYCRELAAHFKGRIDHFEMWNEPYWDTFFKGEKWQFMDVFHAGAKGIREGNPDAKVLGYCNEFNNAGQYAAAARKRPIEEKVDYNSMHYYYMGVPGTGEFGVEKIVASYKKEFKEHAGSELWNTEGNIFGGSSFRNVANFIASAGISAPVVSGISPRSGLSSCGAFGFTTSRSFSRKASMPSGPSQPFRSAYSCRSFCPASQQSATGVTPVSFTKRRRFFRAAALSILFATTSAGRVGSSVLYSAISFASVR